MKISEIHKRKKQVLSFEIFPPKKEEDLVNISDTLDLLAELVEWQKGIGSEYVI